MCIRKTHLNSHKGCTFDFVVGKLFFLDTVIAATRIRLFEKQREGISLQQDKKRLPIKLIKNPSFFLHLSGSDNF